MKKTKLFLALMMALILSFACTVFVQAQDVDAVYGEVTVTDGEVTAAAEEETVVTRLIEYVMDNKAVLLGALGDAAIFVVALVIRAKSSATKKGTDSVGVAQAAVVGRMNEMIDSYNSMRKSYDQYGLTEEDRNRVVGVLVAQNTAMLEMLVTAYGNSKNLPQGVKDMIMLKYANCMKSIENDEQILAIVEAVRNNVNSAAIERVSPDLDGVEEPVQEVYA